MKITVSVTIQADDDAPAVVSDVFTLNRDHLAPDTIGLHLDDAKDLLSAVQEKMVDEQARAALAEQAACPSCGAPAGTRTPARSWCGPCSACCALPALAGGTAAARRMGPSPSAP